MVVLIIGVCLIAPIIAVSTWVALTVSAYRGSYRLPGISSVVRIIRDRNAVPHIFASDPLDAFFALGFVHAQDRLWQMEWQRRLATGRLAAVVGEQALPADRLARLMSFGSLSEQGFPLLSGEVRAALHAYAAGVNAWIERAPALPPEFALLRVRPEPWRPTDSLALLRAMGAQMSYNVRQELLVGRAARHLNVGEMKDLFPFLALERDGVAGQAGAHQLRQINAALAQSTPGGASNVWVLSGRYTTTGRPILANDPHTTLGSPGLWYLARIEAPGLQLVGATVPGFPFVLLGHNGRIAWGMTSSGMDVQDLFVERVDPADPSRYLAPGGSLPFIPRQEEIEVSGQAAKQLRLRETRHGPVLSDIGPRAAALADEITVISLAYSGRIVEDLTAEAIYRINFAVDWPQFRDAARLWSVPPQNLVMAGIDGTIAMVTAGRAPVRSGSSGRMPRPGWSGDHDWTGIIPPDDLPVVVNPVEGRIVEANDRVAESRASHFLGDPPAENLRARRINALLDQHEKSSIASSLAIQSDIFGSDAEILVPLLMRAHLQDERSRVALAMLAKWDFQMRADGAEPLIYMAWIRELLRTLLAHRLHGAFTDYWEVHPAALVRMLARDDSWCERAGGSCVLVLGNSLARALDDLAIRFGPDLQAWRWGAAHRADLAHPVWSRVPGVAAWVNNSVPLDGGSFTVGRASVDFSRNESPYTAVFGAAFRAVYDLVDLSRSRFMAGPGQSGNPASSLYAHLIDWWRRGHSISIAGTAAELEEEGSGTIVLTPQ